MKIIVGLGNPEPEYEKTRHNMGFNVVNAVAEKLKININEKKFCGLVGTGSFGEEKIVLLKPQTYMNLSGKSIIQCMNFYKIEASDVVIVYDDIDLPVGKMRIKNNGSAGTHTGMKSVVEYVR
jgi:PTH1 family peptidyl-tRNA hydrolase